MNEAFWLIEDELVESAVETPLLSEGLRSRVLKAALESRSRRRYGRRVVVTVAMLFLAVAIVVWCPAISSVGTMVGGASLFADDQAQAQVQNCSMRYGSGRLLAQGEEDDWQLVEAETRSREIGSLTLRTAF